MINPNGASNPGGSAAHAVEELQDVASVYAGNMVAVMLAAVHMPRQL